MQKTIPILIPDRSVTFHMPAPAEAWPPPEQPVYKFAGDVPEEDRMAIVALLDLEFAQDCRRWWGAINQHMREHGICWSYNRSRGTISVVLQPDDPNWAGVDPAIVGELAVLVLRERGQTGQTDFMRSYVRPTLHRVHWPRLAKSLGLET